MNTEAELLNTALEALARQTGFRLQVLKESTGNEGQPWDALLYSPADKGKMPALVRNHAQHLNLGALVEQVRRLGSDALLVADYVNPPMAARLREQGVQFADMAGNAYIHHPPVYIYVQGQRLSRPLSASPTGALGRAFEPKGLQVIFTFLCNPQQVAASYREIAAQAGVSVGTVGWVMKGLQAAGFIRQGGVGEPRELMQCQRLLRRWVENYPERLRPRHLVGVFVAQDPDWWRTFDLEAYDGCWGGEIAAASLSDGYLRPEVATLYLPEPARMDLLRDARLRKLDEGAETPPGRIMVYRPFWPEAGGKTLGICQQGYTHPILTYADLVATAEPRNLETAQQIHDRYIAQHCRQD